MVFEIITFIVALLALAVGAVNFLALGGALRDHELFKQGVRRMAGMADANFESDRLRLGQIEKFLIYVFKLDEMFGFKQPQPEEPKLQDNLATPKKGDLKN